MAVANDLCGIGIIRRWLCVGHAFFYCCLLTLVMANNVFAADDCLTVYYAEVPEPYMLIQEKIIQGVIESSKLAVSRHVLTREDQERRDQILIQSLCKAVLVIGRAGLNVIPRLPSELPVVAGGVLMSLGGMFEVPVVSLIPDPEALFLRVRHFAPGVKRVAAIFNPERSAGMIEEAGDVAQKMGLELLLFQAEDKKEALAQYRKFFSQSQKGDALWLVYDNVSVDKRVLLPYIMKQAWRKDVVVVSSRPAHARNGALFSIYADYTRYGGQLSELLRHCQEGGCGASKVIGVRDVDTAVNIRTAAHLGLNFDVENDPFINLVFPRD